jgi:hypothetical protein
MVIWSRHSRRHCQTKLSGPAKGAGHFADLAAKADRRLGFPTISQLVAPKFSTRPNRDSSGANRELFPAEQGKSLAKSPSDGFRKDKFQGEALIVLRDTSGSAGASGAGMGIVLTLRALELCTTGGGFGSDTGPNGFDDEARPYWEGA